MKTKFWMVWNGAGSAVPQVKHETQAAAEAEAERLTTRQPLQTFFVMESVCEYKIAMAQREEHVGPPKQGTAEDLGWPGERA